MRRYIYLAVLVATALALSILEMSLPLPFIAPGAKLGLSNMVILVTLILFGFKEGFIVAVLKSLVLMLVAGSVSSMLYSMAGSVLSVVVMWFTYRYFSNIFSLIGVSILGASAHNFAQITVAALITENIKMYSYLPVLIIVGLFTGYFVGISSKYISNHLRRLDFQNMRRS